MLSWLKELLSSSPSAPHAEVANSSIVQAEMTNESAAWKSRGDKYFNEEKLEDAAACYRQAININPNYAEAYNNLGNVLREQGLPAEAEECLAQAILIKPALANACYNLGSILYEHGKLIEALRNFDKALEINPYFVDAHNYRGIVLMEQGRQIEAAACYQKALALKPDFIDAHYNLGELYKIQGKQAEALSCFKQLMTYEPKHLLAQINMSHLLQQMCAWEHLELNAQAVRRAIMKTPVTDKILAPPFAFMALPGTMANEQKRCAEKYVQGKYQSLLSLRGKLGFDHQRPSNQKISVGYISADFRRHPVSFLMSEVFELHDRSRFNVTAYSYGPDDHSPIRKRLESAFDKFVDIHDRSYEEAAREIYADHIDILIDLTGHTQNSRSGILALRPAPIQVNYLGYPATMGADFVDYLIADRFTIPPEKRQHYTEKIMWMPDCFQANDRTRTRPAAPTRKDCGLPESGFVFCCFNQTFKITPEIFDIWCRLLKAVPDSILWLPASNPHAEGNLRQEVENRGIASERLVMAPLLPTEEHLARLQCADLFLDTLPFNAGTTCSDALWMGLPVVTCAGDAFASRMAGSLLTAIGAPELITYNLDDYFNLALDLATDKDKLEAIHNKIIANRDTSPLFDSARFTRNLEQAYLQMMDEYFEKIDTLS